MQRAKHKVTAAVQEYIRLFPQEWEAFKNATHQKRLDKGDKWAEMAESDVIERHLFDMPETLHYAIKNTLSEDELDWLYRRGEYSGKQSGLRWFMATFPEFSVTDEY